MKNLKITEFTLVTLTMFAPLAGCANPSATIKVRVGDDIGNPIANARVNMYNIYDYGEKKIGLTDEKGFYSDYIKNIFEVSGHFEKPGYYKSRGVLWQSPNWGDVPPAETNFTVVVKRIIEPISMQQKEVRAIFPRLDEPIAFDLEVGDWVFPDGQGKIADMFITGEGFFTSPNDYSFRVIGKFQGEHNGWQSFIFPKEGAGALLRSELPPPPIAPETGYANSFERSVRRFPHDKRFPLSYEETRRWIYRIRTGVDEEGKIIYANYGWMTQDIKIGNPANKGIIELKYYYNPDPHSRSLEPKKIADRQGKE